MPRYSTLLNIPEQVTGATAAPEAASSVVHEGRVKAVISPEGHV